MRLIQCKRKPASARITLELAAPLTSLMCHVMSLPFPEQALHPTATSTFSYAFALRCARVGKIPCGHNNTRFIGVKKKIKCGCLQTDMLKQTQNKNVSKQQYLCSKHNLCKTKSRSDMTCIQHNSSCRSPNGMLNAKHAVTKISIDILRVHRNLS